MSAALALGCAGAEADPHDEDAGSVIAQHVGAGSPGTIGADANSMQGQAAANQAPSQPEEAAACPRNTPGAPLFGIIDRDANNNSWLWGVSYTGPAKVGGLIGTRRIITFDDPTMMGRQLEIESTSNVVRGLQMGQSLWVTLRGSDGPYAPSLVYDVFRESEGGPILFASYGVAPATQPASAPDDPDLLDFTVSIADGCHAMVPPDMACFQDSVRTQLLPDSRESLQRAERFAIIQQPLQEECERPTVRLRSFWSFVFS